MCCTTAEKVRSLRFIIAALVDPPAALRHVLTRAPRRAGGLLVSTHTANLRFWEELFLSKVETRANYARTHQQLLVARLRIQLTQRQQLLAKLGRDDTASATTTLDAYIEKGERVGGERRGEGGGGIHHRNANWLLSLAGAGCAGGESTSPPISCYEPHTRCAARVVSLQHRVDLMLRPAGD